MSDGLTSLVYPLYVQHVVMTVHEVHTKSNIGSFNRLVKSERFLAFTILACSFNHKNHSKLIVTEISLAV